MRMSFTISRSAKPESRTSRQRRTSALVLGRVAAPGGAVDRLEHHLRVEPEAACRRASPRCWRAGVVADSRLLSAFSAWPGPVRADVLDAAAEHLQQRAAGHRDRRRRPPTMTVSVPVERTATPPETGASTSGHAARLRLRGELPVSRSARRSSCRSPRRRARSASSRPSVEQDLLDDGRARQHQDRPPSRPARRRPAEPAASTPVSARERAPRARRRRRSRAPRSPACGEPCAPSAAPMLPRPTKPTTVPGPSGACGSGSGTLLLDHRSATRNDSSAAGTPQ